MGKMTEKQIRDLVNQEYSVIEDWLPMTKNIDDENYYEPLISELKIDYMRRRMQEGVVMDRELLIAKFIETIDAIKDELGSYPKQVMVKADPLWIEIDLEDDD